MKNFLKKMGFVAKDNTKDTYIKTYKNLNNYIVEVDFDKGQINYGNKIKAGRETTQNFSQEENRVVLECVNRLLEKGYKPEDIILEQKFTVGHGASGGRLDVFVKKDGKAFLMIECKTRGYEYEKELKNTLKNGGQLFTYFRQDINTEYLVLYASNLKSKGKIEYKNDIIKIEESYRETSNVVDFYTRWNKFTKQNGIFEDWVNSYNFESRALTLNDLEDIKESDASFIFNRFLEILRHNTVSDKGNAFNKIFTLFLCKIHDEGTKRKDEELEFQWKEGIDNNITFQTRLTDLYKRGMMEFLDKEITDFSDKQINDEFGYLGEDIRIKILEKFTKIRLQKNNEFAIKEVFDDETFEDNAIVLKEVVELLQNYRVRYTKKQPFLGDFFELLLTTGLKQEAGQFFTPVPIARFICKSIPIRNIIENKIIKGDSHDLLPTTIDYAAGSGHFLTEAMEEIQNIINNIDDSETKPNIKKEIDKWKTTTFDWAYEYMYGIEKDYRLVKTAKVGCYLHGDGIATVIHGDGLDSFENSKTYKEKLKKFNPEDKQEVTQFDLVLSNPPYSVSACRGSVKQVNDNAEKDFELFKNLTDQSSEIEALFIERTSQLLKEGGIAGIILPSSILSNTGIYSKAREIILKDFDIIAITELGSNTFMATGTNTVILFLRKRNKFFARNLKASTDNFFVNLQDITLNGIEKAISKYINEVWEGINFQDYISIIQKNPNENIQNHEIYKEYQNKIKLTKKSTEDREKEFFDKITEIEKEKLFYFILTYPQKLVLVKSGEKKIEKEFLGYEFSTRKGSEGIHPIQRGKLIDECTQLFDTESFDNPEKASTYIYENFKNNNEREINEKLKDHIFRTQLSDLLTFDRVDFEKTISLNVKKKTKIETKWNLVKISDSIIPIKGNTTKIAKNEILEKGNIPVITQEKENFLSGYSNNINTITDIPLVMFGDHSCSFKYINFNFIRGADGTVLLKPNNLFIPEYFYNILNIFASELIDNKEKYQRHYSSLKSIQIPLPPKDVQQKIVDEIGIVENIEEKNNEKIGKLKENIEKIVGNINGEKQVKIGEIVDDLFAGGDLPQGNYIKGNKTTNDYQIPIYSNGLENNGLYGFTNKARVEKECVTISARGTIGFPIERKNPFYPIVRLLVLIPKKELAVNKYLVYTIKNLNLNQFGVATPQLTVPQISNFKIPLPSIETQKQIISEIEKIEKEIEILKQENNGIPNKKKEILKKYL